MSAGAGLSIPTAAVGLQPLNNKKQEFTLENLEKVVREGFRVHQSLEITTIQIFQISPIGRLCMHAYVRS